MARVGSARPHEPVVVGRHPHSLLRSHRRPLRPHCSLPQYTSLALLCPSTSHGPFVLPPPSPLSPPRQPYGAPPPAQKLTPVATPPGHHRLPPQREHVLPVAAVLTVPLESPRDCIATFFSYVAFLSVPWVLLLCGGRITRR